MKTLSILLATSLSLAPAATAGDLPDAESQPLRPRSQCLIPDDVKNWVVIDDRRLVVEAAGDRFFDIQLTSDCTELRTRPYISFSSEARPWQGGTRADDMGAEDDRICGDANDAVVARGGEPMVPASCAIAGVRRIDQSTYDSISGESTQEDNGLIDPADAGSGVAQVD